VGLPETRAWIDSIAVSPAQRREIRDLFSHVFDEERTPEMELIAQSISSIEPGGGQMIDLARALLNGPQADA